jgi:hypothetical protein
VLPQTERPSVKDFAVIIIHVSAVAGARTASWSSGMLIRHLCTVRCLACNRRLAPFIADTADQRHASDTSPGKM